MIKKYLFCNVFILMMFCSSAVGFTNNDIGEHGADTTLINKFIYFCFDDKTVDSDSALFYGLKAFEYSRKINYKAGINKILKKIEISSLLNKDFINTNEYQLYLILLSETIKDNTGLTMIVNDSLGCYLLRNKKYLEAIACFQKVLELDSKNDISIQDTIKILVLTNIAVCYNKIGKKYDLQGNSDKTIECCKKALAIYHALDNKKGIAGCYNNIGMTYIGLGNNFLAFEYLYKALKINEELVDKRGIASNLTNIGILYKYEGAFYKSLECFSKALKLYKEINNIKGISVSYNNIGMLYIANGNYVKGIECYQNSLKINEELGDKHGIAMCYGNLGEAYMFWADYPKALEYLNKSLEITIETGDNSIMPTVYENTANIYCKLKKYDIAIENAIKELKIVKETKALINENEAYRILKDAYFNLGNYKESMKYAELYIKTRDSLYNSEKSKQIIEIQNKYEFGKKEQQIKLLEKDNEFKELRQNVIFGGSALFVIIGLLFFRNQKIKLKTARLKGIVLTHEKEIIQKELIYKSKDFEKLAMQIVQNNKFLEELKNEIADLSVNRVDNVEKIEKISKAINQKVYLLEQGRQEFEFQIDQVHHNFFMKLNNRFPELTKNDLRLCTLLVMDFNTKDIASLLNIAPESVRMSRYRLKKKLNLLSEEDLIDFLKNKL